MAKLDDFFVSSDNQRYNSDSFRDTALFRRWLLAKDHEKSQYQNPAFDFIYALVQEMQKYRYWAEEDKNPGYLIRNRRKELPLSYAKLQKRIQEESAGNEPPETVITQIAKYQIHILDAVLLKIRKMLRQERCLTPISKIQQMDSHCLIWYTRQPGNEPEEKAGAKQKLMSVVRRETYDILENRVLKNVLEMCVSYCKHYLKTYGGTSKTITAVKRLLSTAKLGLSMTFMTEISGLYHIPVPNYVLQHDPLYSAVWKMYTELLRQTDIMEYAWKKRHIILREYVIFKTVCAIHEYAGNENVPYQGDFWFSSDLKRDNFFMPNTLFQRVFIKNNIIYEFSFHDNGSSNIHYHAKIKFPGHKRAFSVNYVPNLSEEEILPSDKTNVLMIVFSEDRNCLRRVRESSSNLYILLDSDSDNETFHQFDERLKKWLKIKFFLETKV